VRENLDTVQESPASTIRIHLILTDGCLIKSEDSIPADGLSRSNVSVSVVEPNADCGQWACAGGSRPVESIRAVQSLG